MRLGPWSIIMRTHLTAFPFCSGNQNPTHPVMAFHIVTSDVGGILDAPEVFVHFHVYGNQALKLACNCAGEVWKVQSGRPNEFLGHVGDRAVETKMFSRPFLAPEKEEGVHLIVRVRWIRTRSPARKEYTTVTCRRTADEVALWVDKGEVRVTAALESGTLVGQRACSQQGRQTAHYPVRSAAALPLLRVVGKRYNVMPALTPPLQERTMELKKVSVSDAVRTGSTVVDDKFKEYEYASGHALPCFHSVVFDRRNRAWMKHTVLGSDQVGPHRVTISTGAAGGCIVVFSEVPTYEENFAPNRLKTKLAVYVAPGTMARVFGLVGFRYLHIFQDWNSDIPRVWAWRHEYPFDALSGVSPLHASICGAVFRNLRACVTWGAIVDTCWREDTQWTGDACVVLRVLTQLGLDVSSGHALAAHTMHQIADSYHRDVGMVAAVTPIPAHATLFIPSYHLAYCMLPWQGVPGASAKVSKVIERSVDHWARSFIKDDGLLHVPGPASDARVWHFVDWAAGVSSRDKASTAMDCNAVLNAQWVQLHALRGTAHGVSVVAYQEAFACSEVPGAFSVLRGEGVPSVHATTAAILAGVAPDVAASGRALLKLVADWRKSPMRSDDFGHGGPTAYYAAFVCDALRVCESAGALPRGTAFEYGVSHYESMAARWGTLVEKKAYNASLAHSWSVGIARHVFAVCDDK